MFLVITSTDVGKICSYTLLGLSCFFGYYFTMWFVPETKDRSLEECIALVQSTRYRRLNKEGKHADLKDQIELSAKLNA